VRSRRFVEAVVLGALVLLPLVVRDAATIERFGGYLLLAIFAISVDLIWGYGGLFTFGHAVFFGGGGYVVAILTTRSGWILPLPFWVALVIAGAAAALLALVMGYFTFSGRLALRGVEFAIVTLAVAVMAERLARAGGAVSGGQNGILTSTRLGIPGLISFHKGAGYYVFALILLVIAYLGVKRFLASRSGLVVRGIRDNEDRVDLLGYDVPREKRRVFVLSAVIASLAGAIYFTQFGIVSPASVGVAASTLVLLWVVLGGRGTLIGPVVGAIFLPALTNSLSRGRFLDVWLVIVGVVLVAVILVMPSGIFGFLDRSRE
jgi:ABC-type branched-subunit amino acid transport system permease subunit